MSDAFPIMYVHENEAEHVCVLMQMKFKRSSVNLLVHQRYSHRTHRTQRQEHVMLILMRAVPVNPMYSCPVNIPHTFVFHITVSWNIDYSLSLSLSLKQMHKKCVVQAPQNFLKCVQTEHKANLTGATFECNVNANTKADVSLQWAFCHFFTHHFLSKDAALTLQ